MQVILVDHDDKLTMSNKVRHAISHIRAVGKIRKNEYEESHCQLFLNKRKFWRKFNPFLKKLDENNLKEYLLRKLERVMKGTLFDCIWQEHYANCFMKEYYTNEIRHLAEIDGLIHYAMKNGLDVSLGRNDVQAIENALSLS